VALEAIEPRRLYRQVADQLRAFIEAGGLVAGTRLPTERELADRLNVSRPTIREALIALEVEGRVRIRVGSGIYVADAPADAMKGTVEVDGPFEILRARAFIEGAVAAEAALLVRSADIAKLDAAILAMDQVRHPSADALRIDREFHVAIASVIGNPVVERIVGELFDQRMTPYFGRLAEHFEDAESWREAVREHRAIRNALAARDASLARDALRRHLERSQERFSRSFGEGDYPADAREQTLPLPLRRVAIRSQ
jgi:DNA-binding FadR family transcriptional regulator